MTIDDIKKICIFGGDISDFSLSLRLIKAGFKVIIYYRFDKICRKQKKKFDYLLTHKNIEEKLQISDLRRKIDFTTDLNYSCEETDLIIDISGDFRSSPNTVLNLDFLCKPGTIFLLNLSNKSFIKKLATIKRQEEIVGFIFHSPLHIRKKVRLLKRSSTSENTINIVSELIKSIGKIPKIAYKDTQHLSIDQFLSQLLIIRNMIKRKSSDNTFSMKNNMISLFQYCKKLLYKNIYLTILEKLKSLRNHSHLLKIWLIKRIYKKKDDKGLRINIGGGPFFKKHWRVLDLRSIWYSYPDVYIDYEFNLTSNKPLPFKDCSVSFFYSSHTFEHIPKEYCDFIFKELYRCLKPGGAVRLTMPDFDKAYNAYKNNDEKFFEERSASGADKLQIFLTLFLSSALRGEVNPEEFDKNFKSMKKEEFADYYTPPITTDVQNRIPGGHVNWWNFDKLKRLLNSAGFKKVVRLAPNKSLFKDLLNKKKEKYFDTTRVPESIFIEAIK